MELLGGFNRSGGRPRPRRVRASLARASAPAGARRPRRSGPRSAPRAQGARAAGARGAAAVGDRQGGARSSPSPCATSPPTDATRTLSVSVGRGLGTRVPLTPAGVASPTLARCPPPAGSYAMAELPCETCAARRRPPGPVPGLEEDTVGGRAQHHSRDRGPTVWTTRAPCRCRGVPARHWAPPGGCGAAAGGAERGPVGAGPGWVEPAWAGVGARRVGGACGRSLW